MKGRNLCEDYNLCWEEEQFTLLRVKLQHVIQVIIIIITSLFTEDNILSTYKHLSNIWSSFKTNYTVIHKTHIYNTNTNIYS